MRLLRRECAWKREQTHTSLIPFVREEAEEVVEAIESGDPAALCDELGDLLLQVVIHAVIAEEAGHFTLDDVARGVIAKMERRNPHVFGDAVAHDAAEVLTLWNAAKAAEKAEKAETPRAVRIGDRHGRASALVRDPASVHTSASALTRAAGGGTPRSARRATIAPYDSACGSGEKASTTVSSKRPVAASRATSSTKAGRPGRAGAASPRPTRADRRATTSPSWTAALSVSSWSTSAASDPRRPSRSRSSSETSCARSTSSPTSRTWCSTISTTRSTPSILCVPAAGGRRVGGSATSPGASMTSTTSARRATPTASAPSSRRKARTKTS